MNKETTIFFHYIEYGLFKEFVIEVDLLIEMKRSVHGVPVLLPLVFKNLYFQKVFNYFRGIVSLINDHGDIIIIYRHHHLELHMAKTSLSKMVTFCQ